MMSILERPRRGDKARCAECGTEVEWQYHHGAFQWTTVIQYAVGLTSYCYPFKDWKKKHRINVLVKETT